MAKGLRAGINCVLAYNTGTYLIPVWTVVAAVKDAKLNLTKSVGDASSRISSWKMVLPILKEISIEYEILADTSLAAYDALKLDYVNDTVVDLAVADGAIATTGTEYFRLDTVVTEFTIGQPLEGADTVTVKHQPVYSTNVPAFTTAA